MAKRDPYHANIQAFNNKFSQFRERALAAGYSEDQVMAFRSQAYQPYLQQAQIEEAQLRTQATKPTAQPQKKKGFWTDQISTGGGIAGALSGAAGGAALGTAVGPIGTAAGGILGALIGGFSGGAAGEVAENVMTGDEWHKNALKEGAINGVFGAGPIRAASLVARTGAGLAKGAGKDALAQAGTKALTDKPIRNMLSKPLVNMGDRATTRGVGLSGSQIGKVEERAGMALPQFMRSEGLQGAGVDDITAHVGTLNKQFGDIVSRTGNVPKVEVQSALNSLKKNLTGPNMTVDDARVAKQVADELEFVLAKQGDMIPAKTLNSIKSRFDKRVTPSNFASDPAKWSVDHQAASVLRDALRTASEKAGAAGAGELKTLGNRIAAARTLEEQAIKQARVGTGNGPIGLRDSIAGALGFGAGGPVGAVSAGAATHALNSRTGQQLVAKGADSLAGRLRTPGPGLTRGGVVGRVGAAGAATGGLNASLANSQPDIQPTGDLAMDSEALLDAPSTGLEGTMTGGMEQPTSAISKDEIMAAMLQDLQTTGGANISKLKTIYELSQPEKVDPMSSQASKDLSNAQAGIDAITNLRSLLSADPSLQRKSVVDGQALGGLVGSLLGTGEYDAARQQAVDVIARLRTGAAITTQEEKRFLKMLPQAFDSPEVASYKLGVLEKAFSTVANRGGGSPQMDALSAY